MELYDTLEELRIEMNKKIDELLKWGIKKDKAEHDYKILLNQTVLRMKSEGVAVGIIDKTCYGVEEVANARLERDIATTQYEVCQEKINALKLEIRVVDAQLQRDWSVS